MDKPELIDAERRAELQAACQVVTLPVRRGAIAGDRMRQGQPRGKGEPRTDRGGSRLEAYVPSDAERRVVLVMAANGDTKEVMAAALGISLNTLVKYFRPEIDEGWGIIRAQMGVALVNQALAGNIGAIRYWLGTHGGPEWRLATTEGVVVSATEDDDGVVHFFMPSNGRDQPEREEEPPTIDGEATPADEADLETKKTGAA